MADRHVPVLLEEALEALSVEPDGVYLDATYGRGGHSAGILARLGAGGRLLIVDRDPVAIECAMAQHGNDSRVTIRHGAFADVGELAAQSLMTSGFSGALFDLGVSSPQLDDPERGFSFSKDGPLDMRMSRSGPSAADWLATVDEKTLADALYRYGEERQSRRIARAIVRERASQPLTTTAALAELVSRVVGRRPGKIHPATRTFQALRIVVNDELNEIERALDVVTRLLRVGGRLVVISFHSLEDRIVKRFIRARSSVAAPFRGLPEIPREARPVLEPVGRLTKPSDAEVHANPRARSARMRVARKCRDE